MKKNIMLIPVLFAIFIVSCESASCDLLHHHLENTSFSPSDNSVISDGTIIRASFDYETDYYENENVYATMYAYDIVGKLLYLNSKRINSNIGQETLEFEVDDDFLNDLAYDYPFRIILTLERINSLMEVDILESSDVVTYYK